MFEAMPLRQDCSYRSQCYAVILALKAKQQVLTRDGSKQLERIHVRVGGHLHAIAPCDDIPSSRKRVLQPAGEIKLRGGLSLKYESDAGHVLGYTDAGTLPSNGN